MDMSQTRIPDFFPRELEAKAEENPDFKIMTFENGDYPDEVLTYADIVIKGRKMAGLLKDRGIKKGDTFILLMRNHPEFVYCLYAATALGAIMVPVDPRIKAERLQFLIKDSKSRGIILSSEFIDHIQGLLQGLPQVPVIGVACKQGFEALGMGEYPDLNEILKGPEVPPPDQRNQTPDAPIQIMYTSGTTGDPKGIVIRGSRFTNFSIMAQLVWQYGPEDKLYTGLSLTHGNAQGVTLIPSLFHSIPSVISRKFTKSRIWDLCRKYGCTNFSLLGGMMMGIYSEVPRSDDADNPVRVVLSAGTPRAIWEAFEMRFQVVIHEWYGAMEGGFAHRPPGVGPIGSFGKPVEGLAEMKVVREDDRECLPGEIGELISRETGRTVEVEYFGNQEASEKKTRGGWLRSGDMCHRDEEGYFFFDYRKGGGLRRAGDFIMPEHVEAIIARHPDVDDVCVYGIPAASGAPGESDVVAAVVAVETGTLNIRSVFRLCDENLERNAVPSFIQVIGEIPKTASEKNLDRVLREQFRKDGEDVYHLGDYL
ncbi:MAG: AMP-binding protein [Deltaproteobacteria bacterium]|nr:AMP-binding protein [Deltaproteobacteria bacterium]